MLIHYTPQVFFVNFIHPSSWLFFPILIQNVCSLIKLSVTKFSVILSVQYTLSFITSFFEDMFSQSGNFYENNLILWYYQIRPKVVCKVQLVHGLMDTISRTKTKTEPLRKLRVCYIFRAVYQSKNHLIPHPVIAAILDVILNVLKRWKTTLTWQSNFPNTTNTTIRNIY